MADDCPGCAELRARLETRAKAPDVTQRADEDARASLLRRVRALEAALAVKLSGWAKPEPGASLLATEAEVETVRRCAAELDRLAALDSRLGAAVALLKEVCGE